MTKSFDVMGVLNLVLQLLAPLLGGGGLGGPTPAFPFAPGTTISPPMTPAPGPAPFPPAPAPGGPFGLGPGPSAPAGGQSVPTPGAAAAPAPPSQTGAREGFITHDPTRGHPRITRGFGRKWHPIDKRMKGHSGIDISKARGSGPDAVAVGAASVVFRGRKGGYGNTVILKHAGGYQTLYAHLDSFAVAKNTSIAGGTAVGRIGSTGKSTGPHLHFEVIKGGAKIDPKPLFPNYPYAQ